MTKLLAFVAMAVCFTTNANASLPEAVKPLVATVEYTAAVPVKVTQAAWNRINENSHNANLLRLIAEDTSQCVGAAQQPFEIPACTLDMGGSFVVAIWSTAGYFVADVTEIAFGAVTGILGSWAQAFNACYEATKASLALPVGLACKVISFTLDAAGTIIRVVGNVTAAALKALVGGVGLVVSNLFALPANLLRGNIEAVFKNLFMVVRTVVVCVVPLAPIVMALLGRSKEVNALCK